MAGATSDPPTSEPTVRLDIDRVLRLAADLSIPRQAGTDGDARTIEAVRRHMEDAGLDVTVENFTFDRNAAMNRARALLVVLALSFLGVGLMLPGSPTVALPVLAVSLACIYHLSRVASLMVKLYDETPLVATANVVGRHRPEGASTQAPAVIVLAHHDSKSQSLTFPWRMGATLGAILGCLGVVGCLILSLVLSVDSAPWPAALPARLPAICGVVAASALLLLSTIRSGNRSPGGVDNGGSLALLLEMARHLPAAGPDGVEWIFLSPGAEEDYMMGVREFLSRHRAELSARPVQALNFDGAGNPGRAALIERHGPGPLAAPGLSKLAREISKRLDIPIRGVTMPPAIGIDSMPFEQARIPCVSWSSGSLGRATLAIHSAGDVAPNLDAETLGTVGALGSEMALEMAGLLAVGDFSRRLANHPGQGTK